MKVKALVTFGGTISMYKGEVREVEKEEVLDDLLASKYVEEVKPEKGGKKK